MLFRSLFGRYTFLLAVKTWLSACVCVTCYANQRNEEAGQKRPNTYCEADFQMKSGAYCCDNRTADPAAVGDAEMDDRLTAMWGLATLSVGQGGVGGGAGGHSILLMGWLVS